METQILNEILANLKSINSTVIELKEGQARLTNDVATLKEGQARLESNQVKFDKRLQNLEKISFDLREDVKTIYSISMHSYNFLTKHFHSLGFNDSVYDVY